MKILFVHLFMLLLWQASRSQDVKLPTNERGEIEFTEVISVDSAGSSTLYSRARLFVANAFNSSTDVTKLEDASTGTIVTKGLLPRNYINPFNKGQGGHVSFKLTIQCKDGRYRYSVTDFVHQDRLHSSFTGGPLENERPQCGTFNMPRKSWEKIKSETAARVERFVAEMKATMNGSTVFSANDDW